MKRIAIVLMLITIFSKLFGFLREITLSYFYGASSISDAYLISLTIPGVIFSFVGTGLATGYIPMYSKIKNDYGEEDASKFTNNLTNIIVLLSSIIILFGLLFTEQLVLIFASGFEGETLELAVKFTRISLIGVFFSGLVYIYNGYLQIKSNFIVPALIGFPLNIIIITSIYLSSHNNILILIIGSVIATASQLLFILPFVFKKGHKYKFIIDIKDQHFKTMAYMALPIIIGVSVNQINVLVDRTLASQIAIGGISALNYANKLNGFVQGLFVVSISTVMYPMISKMSAERNIIGLKKAVSEALTGVNLLVIPATIGFMIFTEPIVKLLFGRGAFDSTAMAMTSQALFFYAIGMIGFGLRDILSRAFYSLQDTKTPMINASIAVVMNIILNIILSKYLGIGGLALATSISALFCTLLLLFSLRKKIGPLGLKNTSITFIKILSASIIMGIISKLSYDSLINYLSGNLSLLIAIAIAGIVYFFIIYFIKIEEVDTMILRVKIKMKIGSTNE